MDIKETWPVPGPERDQWAETERLQRRRDAREAWWNRWGPIMFFGMIFGMLLRSCL